MEANPAHQKWRLIKPAVRLVYQQRMVASFVARNFQMKQVKRAVQEQNGQPS